MRNAKRFGWGALVLLSMFTVACGMEEQVEPGLETGDLEVSVHALTGPAPVATDLGNIASITVDIKAGGTIVETLVLERHGNSWTATTGQLPVGNYSAIASATFTDSSEAWFSGEEALTISKNATSTVAFVIHQDSGSDFGLPQFTAIHTNKNQVKTGEDLAVWVSATGRSDLTLWARNWGGNPAGTSWDGAGVSGQATPDATPGTRTSGLFTPPGPSGHLVLTAGEVPNTRGFVLVLTDSRGNNAEMGMFVPVVPQTGNVQATVTFNMAPVVGGHVRVLNDGDATTAYLWFSATDDNGGVLNWSWSASNECHGPPAPNAVSNSGGSWRSGGFNGAVVDSHGTMASGEEKFIVFQTSSQLPAGQTATCHLALTVTDAGGARTRVTYDVKRGLLAPAQP